MPEISEVIKKLKMELPDEISGIKEYAELSKMAENSGCVAWAEMLRDMAAEESTHAKHIMYILDKSGIPYAEYTSAYEDAKKMLFGV